MAFSTIQGSGAAPDSFVGTSGVDTILIQNVRKPVFLGAQGSGDSITFQNFTGLVSEYTLKGGQGDDVFTSTATNISLGFINGNADVDDINLIGVSQSTVFGGQGADKIRTEGLVLGSVINGNANADHIDIDGGGASSSIFGGQGVDKIDVTGTFTDVVIQGDKDNDTIHVNKHFLATSLLNTTVNGNDGNDKIIVNALTSFTNSTVFGGEGGDTINASAAGVAVFLSGDAGNDDLIGGIGADSISGGDGTDSMTGDAGKDTFLYTSVAQTGTVSTAAGNDVITDFTSVTAGVIQDTIKGFGVAGVGAGAGINYLEGAGGADYAAALATANAAFGVAGTNTQYFLASYGAGVAFNAVLFVDLGSTGTAQGAILIGNTASFASSDLALASFEAGNILA